MKINEYIPLQKMFLLDQAHSEPKLKRIYPLRTSYIEGVLSLEDIAEILDSMGERLGATHVFISFFQPTGIKGSTDLWRKVHFQLFKGKI